MPLNLSLATVTPLLPAPIPPGYEANLEALVAEVNLWVDNRYGAAIEYTDAMRLVVARYTAQVVARRLERGTGQAINQKAGTFAVAWDTSVSGIGLFDPREVAALDAALGRGGITSLRLVVDDAIRFGNRLGNPPPRVTLTGGHSV